MTRRHTAMLLVALLLVPPPAGAYLKFGVEAGGRTVPIRWPSGVITYVISDRDGPGATALALGEAVGRATATWSRVPGLPVTFSAQGLTRSQPLEVDGRSTIGFLDRPEQDRVLGAATFLLDAATGAIIESDIFFNARFRWSTAAGGEAGANDLESVAVHEIGHLLGLGHSALGETEVVAGGRRVTSTGAAMFPIAWPAGSIADRVLQDDDVAGIRDLYDALPAAEFGSIQGRVTKDGGGVFGAHVVALGLDSGTLVGSYSLSADGQFVIAGLPPGPYVLRVEPLDDADLESFFSPGRIDIAFGATFADRIAVVPAGGSTRSIAIAVRRR